VTENRLLFGHDREVNELTKLLSSERVVMLYGPPGAGKTSLIRAGLIPRVKQEKFEVLPVIHVGLEPRKRSKKKGVHVGHRA
jgi:replication-associated recombination protein RarA